MKVKYAGADRVARPPRKRTPKVPSRSKGDYRFDTALNSLISEDKLPANKPSTLDQIITWGKKHLTPGGQDTKSLWKKYMGTDRRSYEIDYTVRKALGKKKTGKIK